MYSFPNMRITATIGNKTIPDINLFIFIFFVIPSLQLYLLEFVFITYFAPNLRFLVSNTLIASSKSASEKSGQYLSTNRNSV